MVPGVLPAALWWESGHGQVLTSLLSWGSGPGRNQNRLPSVFKKILCRGGLAAPLLHLRRRLPPPGARGARAAPPPSSARAEPPSRPRSPGRPPAVAGKPCTLPPHPTPARLVRAPAAAATASQTHRGPIRARVAVTPKAMDSPIFPVCGRVSREEGLEKVYTDSRSPRWGALPTPRRAASCTRRPGPARSSAAAPSAALLGAGCSYPPHAARRRRRTARLAAHLPPPAPAALRGPPAGSRARAPRAAASPPPAARAGRLRS